MIDILVPVLGRPQNVEPFMESFEAATTTPYKVWFLCSLGDPEQVAECDNTGEEVVLVTGPAGRADYARKMNAGFTLTSQPFLFLAADDIQFLPGWDTESLWVAEETGAGVIGVDDLFNPGVSAGHFSTHPLVRRSYIEEQGGCLEGPGVLVSPQYDHNCTDLELAELAQSRGQWAFAPKAKVQHLHPGYATNVDATYKKGRRFYARDRQTFLRRQRQWKPR